MCACSKKMGESQKSPDLNEYDLSQHQSCQGGGALEGPPPRWWRHVWGGRTPQGGLRRYKVGAGGG